MFCDFDSRQAAFNSISIIVLLSIQLLIAFLVYIVAGKHGQQDQQTTKRGEKSTLGNQVENQEIASEVV